jgi:hypothetical protein
VTGGSSAPRRGADEPRPRSTRRSSPSTTGTDRRAAASSIAARPRANSSSLRSWRTESARRRTRSAYVTRSGAVSCRTVVSESAAKPAARNAATAASSVTPVSSMIRRPPGKKRSSVMASRRSANASRMSTGPPDRTTRRSSRAHARRSGTWAITLESQAPPQEPARNGIHSASPPTTTTRTSAFALLASRRIPSAGSTPITATRNQVASERENLPVPEPRSRSGSPPSSGKCCARAARQTSAAPGDSERLRS